MSLVPSPADQENLYSQIANMDNNSFYPYFQQLFNMTRTNPNAFAVPHQVGQPPTQAPVNPSRPNVDLSTLYPNAPTTPQPDVVGDYPLIPPARVGTNSSRFNNDSNFFGDHIANSIPRAMPQNPNPIPAFGSGNALGGLSPQPKPVAPKPQPQLTRVSPGVYRNSAGSLVNRTSIPKTPVTKPMSNLPSGIGNNIFNRAR